MVKKLAWMSHPVKTWARVWMRSFLPTVEPSLLLLHHLAPSDSGLWQWIWPLCRLIFTLILPSLLFKSEVIATEASTENIGRHLFATPTAWPHFPHSELSSLRSSVLGAGSYCCCFNVYLSIWQHLVLVAACGLFSCSMRTQLWHVGSSSLTRDHIRPALEVQRLSHWTTREVPL